MKEYFIGMCDDSPCTARYVARVLTTTISCVSDRVYIAVSLNVEGVTRQNEDDHTVHPVTTFSVHFFNIM